MQTGFRGGKIANPDGMRADRPSKSLGATALDPFGTTESRMQRVRHYFERAEELRTVADDVKSRETRLMLLSLALSYERMALLLQQIRLV